ncbi:MAG: hypothetical protein KBF64_08505 [Anaerolineaceae bacterium]|nr:hypothetical protein [Anaerolineaceae bacterium]
MKHSNETKKDAEQSFKFAVKNLYKIAILAYNEIIHFKPEIVIVLAHGGWGPLWALQALCQELQKAPFPPLLVTNIGNEKLDRYEKQRYRIYRCYECYPYNALHTNAVENGFFLAWVSQQTDWQYSLRQMIMEVLNGLTPSRILVLDDTTWVGGTYRIALTLLNSIFPESEVRMIAGDSFEWRSDIVKPWLLDHGINDNPNNNNYRDLYIHYLVPGTEDDGNSDSFNWRLISKENKYLQEVSSLLPIEQWMRMSIWVKKAIQNQSTKYAREVNKTTFPINGTCKPTLDAVELILKYVWLNRKIKLEKIQEILKMSKDESVVLVKSMVEEKQLVPRWNFREVYYVIPRSITRKVIQL